ncbi:MAG: lamin tail domain-containing protein [Pirellula sp.]|jgi:predicted extracellular nuclease
MKLTFKLAAVAFAVTSLFSRPIFGDMIISQYYEGTSNNKWIELTNVGSSTIDLGAGNYRLSGFNNANRSLWLSGNDASINGGTFVLTGNVAAGGTIVLRNGSANTPAYAVAGSINAGTSGVNFNGDDSVVLWAGTSYSFSNIIDTFGITGNTGQDTSFVRNANILTGTNANFNASQWTQFSLADVNSAAVGTTQRLGFHSFSAVPEPATMLLLGVAGIGGFAFRRFRRKSVSETIAS